VPLALSLFRRLSRFRSRVTTRGRVEGRDLHVQRDATESAPLHAPALDTSDKDGGKGGWQPDGHAVLRIASECSDTPPSALPREPRFWPSGDVVNPLFAMIYVKWSGPGSNRRHTDFQTITVYFH